MTGAGTYDDKSSIGGAESPPRVTDWMKPACCKARERVRIMLVEGTEVRPSRPRDAFCRWEHTLERWTRDIMGEFVCLEEG